MNEQEKIEFTRMQLTLTLEEAKSDLVEYGNIAIGAYTVDGMVTDYIFSREYEDEEYPEVPGDVVIEPMRLDEFIERLEYTISMLDKPYNK